MTSLNALRATVQELSDDQIRGAITALVHGLVSGMLGDIAGRLDEIVDNVVHSICDQIAAAAESHQDDTADAAPTPREPAPLEMPGPRDRVKHTCEICGRDGTRRYVQTPTGWRCSPSSADRCKRRAEAQANPVPRDPKYAHRLGRGLPGAASDIPAKDIPANVTPAEDNPLPRTHELIGQLVDGVAAKVITAPAQVDDSAANPPHRFQDVKSVQANTPAAVDQSAPARPHPMPRVTVTRAAKPDTTARCSDCTRTWNLTGRVLDHAIALHEKKHDHIVDILNLEHPANA